MLFSIMEMFISFFSGKVMLFYGITLIMKEKSNASALTSSQTRPNLLPDATESAPRRDRICSQTRLHLLPRSLNGIGLELTPLLPFCQTILSSLNFKRVSQQRLTRKFR